MDSSRFFSSYEANLFAKLLIFTLKTTLGVPTDHHHHHGLCIFVNFLVKKEKPFFVHVIDRNLKTRKNSNKFYLSLTRVKSGEGIQSRILMHKVHQYDINNVLPGGASELGFIE